MSILSYIRISTSDQNTQVQKTELLEYANTNGMIIDKFIIAEVSSTKNAELRKLEELKDTLKNGDTLICTELSRLGRNMVEILNLIEYFKDNDITIIFTKQPELSTNQSTALQSLLFSIYGYFAQTERELLSQRVKGGLINAKKSGKTLGRKQGSTGKSKFDSHKDKILELHGLGLSLNKIVNLIGVGTPPSLRNYIIKVKGLEPI